MARVTHKQTRSKLDNSRWKKYLFIGEGQKIREILNILPNLISLPDQTDRYRIGITQNQSIYLEVQFTDAEELEFLEKYTSISNNNFISSNMTIDSNKCTTEQSIYVNYCTDQLYMQIIRSTENVKSALTSTIFNYFSTRQFEKSNILTLTLYLHLTIIYSAKNTFSQKNNQTEQLFQSYIKRSCDLTFDPEIDYINNQLFIEQIAKDVFSEKKDNKKWAAPFYTCLKDLFSRPDYDPFISNEMITKESMLQELINTTLGLSHREITTLYYFISKAILLRRD